MPQRTCSIVFQTYHTAEPRISTYAQLSPYNKKNSPLFTNHAVQLVSEHGCFCVAQATLGLLKLTQPGRVDCWSFQTLQCVAAKTVSLAYFGHALVWQVMRLSPRYNISSCRTSVLSISWELSWNQENSQSRRHGKKRTA